MHQGTRLQYVRFAPHSTGDGMDAAFGDDSAGAAAVPSPRHIELLLDAIKPAIAVPGEHRLFRSGKLPGLFPMRIGPCADAALTAIRDGLLETVRTESKGKIVTEWVRATPKGVAFVCDHDSPKSVLKEMNAVLDATRAGVPTWMAEAKEELALLSARFEERATNVLAQLHDLAVRVEAALRRAEANGPGLGESVGKVVPWAMEALAYLDRRSSGGARNACSLPELFGAMRESFPETTLTAFQDGVRRLHDVRALRLLPSDAMDEPEYAVVWEGKLMYLAAR